MINKVLTISIAAYNMEQYIRQTLDSLIDEEIIDELEIFVVDDGGTDRTLEIAQEYAEKYPQSIFPIHKENGGYGSTVNYSIAHATGKYFKLLDGDDWFETENLKKLIEQLRMINSDIVITTYFQCIENGPKKENKLTDGYALNTDIAICEIEIRRVFGMWGITYKTEILKKCDMQLPLHCLYTDQIFSTIPFAEANTIRFVDCAVYCYRIGRDGQSVGKEARIKHIGDNIKVCDFLLDFYEAQKKCSTVNIRYIKRRIVTYIRWLVKTYLLMPISEEVMMGIATYDRNLMVKSRDVYNMLSNVNTYKKFGIYMHIIRIFGYGKIALLFSRLILPKDGIKNWA